MRPPVSVAGRALVALAVAESWVTAPPEPTWTGFEPSLVARSWAVGITGEGGEVSEWRNLVGSIARAHCCRV